MSSSLWKRNSFLNDFDYIPYANIVEYDIKAAGFNMLVQSGYLSKKEIEKINSLPKSKRNVAVGLIQRDDKRASEIISKGLEKYRKLFMDENDITDSDILSIKKDAIFVINKRVRNRTFDNIIFRKKRSYTSYYKLGKIEFYYDGKNDVLDVKGLGGRRNDTIMSFLKKVFEINEYDNKKAKKFVYKFANKYRKGKVPFEAYKEFSLNPKYVLVYGAVFDELPDDVEIDDLDISYNYDNFIIPIIKLIF